MPEPLEISRDVISRFEYSKHRVNVIFYADDALMKQVVATHIDERLFRVFDVSFVANELGVTHGRPVTIEISGMIV